LEVAKLEKSIQLTIIANVINISILRRLFFIAVTLLLPYEFIAYNNNYSLLQDIENANSIVETNHESDWKKVQITSNKSILDQFIPKREICL
jgi:hypothetical protein